MFVAFDSRYAALKAAMAARDADAISKLLAPGFVSEDAFGQSEGAGEMIKEVLALPIDPHKVSKTTILSIKRSADRVLVDQRYEMRTTKSASGGDKRDVQLIAVSTDTWTKSDHTWLLQRTVTDQMDYFVNGKQVLHNVRPAGF